MSRNKDEEAATTSAKSVMDNIKQRGLIRRRSTGDAGEMAMYVASFGGDSRAAETEGTDGEEVPSGTAKPATNNSSSISASKSTAVDNAALMELLKAAVQATREQHGDAEEARPKEADQKAEIKAEAEDKESSTTSSAAKLFEQFSGQLSQEDLSRVIAKCQEKLSPGK